MPKARELVASSSLRGAVLANRGMSAQALQEAITMQEGVTPKKHTLYRAKNILLRQEDKTYAKDFQKIASWCQEFQDLGNGMAHMSVDEDNAFLSVTVINRAAARRLVRAGQLVSRVNVASMHHRHYRGQILALEATDGNAKNILVGVRMCPYGTAEQYSGLFRAAKSTEFEPGSRMEAWLNSAGHVVLAGQESEVLPAKQAELPHARTAKCCRHLLATCRSKVGGFKSEELFWAAQQAGTYAM